MHHFQRVFAVGYVAIIVLFTLCAFSLIAYGGIELWSAVYPGTSQPLTKRFDRILECIAMLTIAIASLELADTLVQEELAHEPRMSHAARVRRVLSRFLLVVVIALAIESLVATFKFVHDDPSQLPGAALIAFGAAALLAGWALFTRLKPPSD